MLEKNHENTALEHIQAWLREPGTEELSAKEIEIYDRLDFCYDQLKIDRPVVVARKLMKKYGYTDRSAYYDIQRCQKLFNPINRRDLEWIRNFIVDDAILQIQVAREKFDQRAWNRARADLIKMYAIDKKDKAAIDPEMLGRNNYYITINYGAKAKKINMDELHKLPVNKRVELTSFLFQDVEIEDAKVIMES